MPLFLWLVIGLATVSVANEWVISEETAGMSHEIGEKKSCCAREQHWNKCTLYRIFAVRDGIHFNVFFNVFSNIR